MVETLATIYLIAFFAGMFIELVNILRSRR